MSSARSSARSQSDSRGSSKKPWIITAVLALGCAGTGVWAVPQFMHAQELKDGAKSSFSVPAAVAPSTPETTGSTDPKELEQSLNTIAQGFSAGNISGKVIDAQSGQVLFASAADTPRVPASNFKILTDYTLFKVSDPSARYTTKVTQHDDQLTLVGGGDTLLGTGESNDSLTVGHAGLRTLAQKTVDSLANTSTKKFTVNVDTSMYSGPAKNSAWDPEDIAAGFVNNLAPVAFYSHYSPGADGRSTTERPTDPAGQVQKYLVQELNNLGAQKGLTFEVGGNKTADSSAKTIGAVESATVAEQAAYMMQESDNMLAEVLGRNAAVAAGRQGSEDAAKKLVRETLEQNGISTEGLAQTDLCGLSMDNQVTNTTLTQITSAMVAGQDGESAALAGFPVAGGSGTLESRFDDSNEEAARGYARAKTGTLNKVISLTGYTQNANGQTLVYSFITNDVTDTAAAKNTLDASVAAVADRH
ncbi:MAG: D-alanyl-D-alanine carboxypeptidase/D-alanyl-D-alanine-endopeptidase [Rothia sp. (in: high G+C Gram-positive bacteria)]|nr:D-alanyl-D-alanine carboxypeptidase/D-alanyl-D-alanine-endopeptidase [Rothia sp. (in: high G+C Gram-positive bacteria)]